MRPGRVFTMAGVRYRYLKNMGSNNHMILSDSTSLSTIVNIDTTLDTWFTNLNNSVQNIARPISRTLPVPNLGSI